MKILQLVHTLDPSVGGVATSVLALSRGLARRGHKIDIVVLDDPSAAWIANIDLNVHALGSGLTSYRYSRSLLPWLRQHGDYDRVIVNGIWQYLSFAAWRRYAGSQIPYYVFPHGMLDPWFKETFPLKHLKKWLYWPWAEYRVLRDAAAVIFTSEEERLQARQSFWLYRCREKVSPLGVEAPPISKSAKSEFLARYPRLQNTRNFLFLGRLHPKKGCDILLDAFARVRSADSISLILAGPDQIGWESDLRRQVARLNLANRVAFTGMLQGTIKQGAFACADAFVLPSHQENFGISVVEALAAGVPVLISNRVNVWREIDTDRAGYVESDDLAGTTRLLQRWIDTAPTERETMRQNARNCFEQRFEIDRAVDSLLRILNEVPTVQ
ncbi:MAG TPA: glycosyltransferase [Chthoniobacterales bacterium]|nr:glycosyltransferase [Chthoniobacterales bacterium]